MCIYVCKWEQVSTYHPEGPKASPWPIIQIYFFDPAPAKEQDFGDVDFESEMEWGKTTKEELLLAKARALVSLSLSLSLCARVCNICTGGRKGKKGVNKLLAKARAVVSWCIKFSSVVLCMHLSSSRPVVGVCVCTCPRQGPWCVCVCMPCVWCVCVYAMCVYAMHLCDMRCMAGRVTGTEGGKEGGEGGMQREGEGGQEVDRVATRD